MGKILTRTPGQPNYAPVRTGTFAISVSDATDREKAQADLVASTSSAETEINSLIARMA